MAAEPLTEPIVSSDAAPEAPPAEPARSRRSILGAGLAGLAGLVLGSLGRPPQANANAGDPLTLGAANTAGTTNTSLATNSSGNALLVTQTGAGTALRGSATALNGTAGFFTSANGAGVSGVTANNTKFGVYGGNDAATHGTSAAIRANGEQNHGLVATTADVDSFAIKAVNTNPGTGFSAGSGIRVLTGGALDSTIDGLGLTPSPAAGEFSGPNGIIAMATPGSGIGVYAFSDTWIACFAESSYYAFYSQGKSRIFGNLEVVGSLSKGGGSFKIDHPLDPTNKYLSHSFVESPDMMNVYNGTVTLDAKGEATVTLPDWFEALNRDFRYQLTPIGSFAPLFVKTKVHNGAFSIGGGTPGQEVSWQLTGIRQDAWANANRIPVEEDKPAVERGLYLHPAEHGQAAAHGIDAVRHSAKRRTAGK
jgi:hypothetical protein